MLFYNEKKEGEPGVLLDQIEDGGFSNLGVTSTAAVFLLERFGPKSFQIIWEAFWKHLTEV